MPSTPIIPDTAPFLALLDAPAVALICLGVVLAAVLAVVFVGGVALVRGISGPEPRHRAHGVTAPQYLPPRAPGRKHLVSPSALEARTEVMPAVRTGVAAA